MVIVHIVLGKANPERMNGVNKVVYNLAKNQVDLGRNIELWGITDQLEHNYGERNFKTRLFKKSKVPFTISNKLKKAIIEKEDVVFHLHGGWIPDFWPIAKTLKKHGKKCILTPHGAYNQIAMKKSPFIKKIYFSLFEKSLLDSMDTIHCIGESEKIGLEEIYQNDKQALLPYGFDVVPNNNPVANNSKKFTIGFVGRIDVHTKGLDLLVKAFSAFKIGKDVKLWIVGDSSELPHLQDVSSDLGITNDTVFFGSKFGDAKNRLLQEMDVFVHASRNEGLPTAVLEAASFGVPSIVTKATNVGDYIVKHNAGICINNESITELTEAFENLYLDWKNANMKNYSTGAKAMLDEEFSWKNLVGKYDLLYA